MLPDRSLIHDFVLESLEHLDSIEDDFLALEKREAKKQPERIGKVFRAIHTIKGGAGFLGLQRISDLSHRMETMLSLARSGKIAPASAHIDVLLAGVDRLRAMLDKPEAGNEIHVEDLLGRIDALLGKPDSTEMRNLLRDSKGKKTDVDISSLDLENLPDGHAFLYLLKYDLVKIEKRSGKTPVDVMRELESVGYIIEARLKIPATDLRKGLPKGPVRCHVLFSSALEPDLIPTATGLGQKDVVCLEWEPGKGSDSPAPDRTESAKTSASEAKPAPVPPPGDLQGTEKRDSVRIPIQLLDKLMSLAGELVLVRNQGARHIDRSNPASRAVYQQLDVVTSELQENIMRTRMQPISGLFGRFARVVRDLGRQLNKEIQLITSGGDVELDKAILEGLADPLTHIIRNSCDHGIEAPGERESAGKPATGEIVLKAYHEGGRVNIEISDDGRGISAGSLRKQAIAKGLKTDEELSSLSNEELLSLVFLPGFTTSRAVSSISGRGVGMDVVKSNCERLGGTVVLKSTEGRGSTVLIRLPLTLAIIPSLIVEAAGNRFAIPQVNLEELFCLYDQDTFTKIECAGNREVFRFRKRLLPMVRLDELLKRGKPLSENDLAQITENFRTLRETAKEEFSYRGKGIDSITDLSLQFAVIKMGKQRYGLIVDKVLGTEEIVVKRLHPSLRSLSLYSGTAVLGDGSVALILDAHGVARYAGIDTELDDDQDTEKRRTGPRAVPSKTILLFKNGPKEQFAVDLNYIRRIERIQLSDIQETGNREYITLDGSSTLVLRLDHHLQVSPCGNKEEMFLLIPKNPTQPYGILATELLDVGEYEIKLNTVSHKEDGIEGTSVLRDRLTFFLKPSALIAKARPDWQAEIGGMPVEALQKANAESKDAGTQETCQYCTFWAAGRLWGVDIMDVKEVVDQTRTTSVYHAPDQVSGMMNIRGQTLLVLDLRRLLGFDSQPPTRTSRVIIFKAHDTDPFGVLVDRMGNIVEVPKSLVKERRGQSTSEVENDRRSPVQQELSGGVCRLPENLMIVLVTRRLLSMVEEGVVQTR